MPLRCLGVERLGASRLLRLFPRRPRARPRLVELDEEVFTKPQGPFDVVAVADDEQRLQALRASLTWPLRLKLLRPPQAQRPWRFRWFDVERYLLPRGGPVFLPLRAPFREEMGVLGSNTWV